MRERDWRIGEAERGEGRRNSVLLIYVLLSETPIFLDADLDSPS